MNVKCRYVAHASKKRSLTLPLLFVNISSEKLTNGHLQKEVKQTVLIQSSLQNLLAEGETQF